MLALYPEYWLYTLGNLTEDFVELFKSENFASPSLILFDVRYCTPNYLK
jgi:hypothetical protein